MENKELEAKISDILKKLATDSWKLYPGLVDRWDETGEPFITQVKELVSQEKAALLDKIKLTPETSLDVEGNYHNPKDLKETLENEKKRNIAKGYFKAIQDLTKVVESLKESETR